ncbi:MAG: nucleoside-diphosphate kinase [Candidatus Omnitrophica bacterium]|nr:nucleoside-diphosphate kinase [Candidatus Omnitrophota bacterium]
MKEATLVLVKPDGLKKSLTGNVLTRLSETKLEIVAAKIVRVDDKLAREHYRGLSKEPFFEELIQYIKGELHERKKVMAMAYYGGGAIRKVREIAGGTNPEKADSISIRGQYGRITTKGIYENVIHASTDQRDAEREIKLWFQPDEIIVDLYPTKATAAEGTRQAWA